MNTMAERLLVLLGLAQLRDVQATCFLTSKEREEGNFHAATFSDVLEYHYETFLQSTPKTDTSWFGRK